MTIPSRTFRLKLLRSMAAASMFVVTIGALAQNAEPGPVNGAEAEQALSLRAEHATISVANIQLERDWYIEKLGFAATRHIERGPDFEIWQLTIPGYRIDLVRASGSQRPKASAPLYLQQGWVHIAFTSPDLARANAFLKSAGTDVKADVDEHKSLTRLLVHDPEGNEIEVFPR